MLEAVMETASGVPVGRLADKCDDVAELHGVPIGMHAAGGAAAEGVVGLCRAHGCADS